MPPVLRPRSSTRRNTSSSSEQAYDAAGTDPPHDTRDHFTPPTYIIDLSLPPSQRYVRPAQDFATEIRELTDLFGIVVQSWGLPISPIRLLSRMFLRRLYSAEETAELVGIAQAAKVDMYYLIAFNTFLDLFMGCTSGGARVSEGQSVGDEEKERMLHFRTLDWDMDDLRKLVVRFKYMKDGKHVGTSVGYIGFVGVLTAVKRNLSLSLNFRPNRDNMSFLSNLTFYSHILLVLLGVRPSIASNLRQHFLADEDVSLSDLAARVSTIPSTAAYITLSDGDSIIIMEKDVHSARIQEARDFLAVTNHDIAFEQYEDQGTSAATGSKSSWTFPLLGEFGEFIIDSKDRKQQICDLWTRAATSRGASNKDLRVVKNRSIIKWLETYPIKNECTHFALLMDPKKGKILYLKRYLE
jgi:beta subunit of N-acylethanolamine-hydrolyzing acid amidase